MTNLPIYHTI